MLCQVPLSSPHEPSPCRACAQDAWEETHHAASSPHGLMEAGRCEMAIPQTGFLLCFLRSCVVRCFLDLFLRAVSGAWNWTSSLGTECEKLPAASWYPTVCCSEEADAAPDYSIVTRYYTAPSIPLLWLSWLPVPAGCGDTFYFWPLAPAVGLSGVRGPGRWAWDSRKAAGSRMRGGDRTQRGVVCGLPPTLFLPPLFVSV